ncbi:MAG: hypothetical protein ACI4AI_06060 [Paludibacteraceae bacterium]
MVNFGEYQREENALTEAARTGQRSRHPMSGKRRKKQPHIDMRRINATNGITCRTIDIDAMLTHRCN